MDNMLSCGTPISWIFMSESVLYIHVLKFLSVRKLFMNWGNLAFNPSDFRSFIMPYLQVVLYAFMRSKKMAVRCSFLMKAFWIKVSN